MKDEKTNFIPYPLFFSLLLSAFSLPNPVGFPLEYGKVAQRASTLLTVSILENSHGHI
ncbi:hypothetical protein IQ244_11735 [Nostoc sp. LEGE 06077]|nr:hypothetical protein [Nostoc sp. LEGE 06077]